MKNCFSKITITLSIFMLVLMSVASYADGYETKIIGGSDATPHEYPWAVQIRTRGVSDWRQNHRCGGALLSSRVVVTAAHCLYGVNASQLQVVLGEHRRSVNEGTEQVFNVRSIRRHPSHVLNTLHYDVGIIVLDGTAAPAPGVIEFADVGRGGFSNDILTTIGWGIDDSGVSANVLQEGEIEVLPWDECRIFRETFNPTMSSQNFCGTSTVINTCHGDSGSPVMALGTNVVVGVVSGGRADCGGDTMLYTNFSNTSWWVQSWVDYYAGSHPASMSCNPVGTGATMCSYQGDYIRDMDFYWTSTRSGQVVYPSYGSFPYKTKNSVIIFTSPGSSACPSGTRIGLTTTFWGLSMGTATYTCP